MLKVHLSKDDLYDIILNQITKDINLGPYKLENFRLKYTDDGEIECTLEIKLVEHPQPSLENGY